MVDTRGFDWELAGQDGEVDLLPVGAVLVVRHPMAGIAAYIVGEEEHQVGG